MSESKKNPIIDLSKPYQEKPIGKVEKYGDHLKAVSNTVLEYLQDKMKGNSFIFIVYDGEDAGGTIVFKPEHEISGLKTIAAATNSAIMEVAKNYGLTFEKGNND